MAGPNSKLEKAPNPSLIQDAGGILQILTQVLGDKGTSETITKGISLDPSILMKQALEAAGTYGFGKQGLASTLTAGKRAGVYGGKSNELNLNDLMARITAEANIASTPTVQTRTGIGAKNAAVNPLLLGAGGAALLYKSPELRKKLGIDELWGEIFGEGKGSAIGAFGTTPFDSSAFDAWSGSDLSLASSIGTTEFIENALVTPEQLGVFQGIEDNFANMSSAGAGSSLADVADIGTEFFGGWAENGAAIAADGSDLAFNIGLDTAGDAASGGIPYLGAALNLAEGDIGGAVLSGAGFALGGPIGGLIGGLVDSIIGDDCYITTATTRNQYKPDDCHELQMMRRFRDEFGTLRHPAEVADYYETAPLIVAAIRAREDAREILDTLYIRYIVPAVKYAEQERYEEAYEVYSAMVTEAKKYLVAEA